MRFELTPKNNQRKNANTDIYTKDKDRKGNIITSIENSRENIIQNTHLFCHILVETIFPRIAQRAEYKNIYDAVDA
jgi:hypothetical protein